MKHQFFLDCFLFVLFFSFEQNKISTYEYRKVEQINFDLRSLVVGVVSVVRFSEIVESQIVPLVFLLANAFAGGPVVGVGIGQLAQRNRDVVVRQFILSPIVVDNLQQASVDLNLTVHSELTRPT
jgi:hypothetical protein